jgi:hypothetical protein
MDVTEFLLDRYAGGPIKPGTEREGPDIAPAIDRAALREQMSTA